MQDHAGAQCNLGVLTEAVESNTQLIEFEIDNAELNEQNTDKINSLLTQNKYIADLRQYVEDHSLVNSAGFPLDIATIMVDKMIVAFLRKGQTKEATQKAVDEFLVSVSVKALQEEAKI